MQQSLCKLHESIEQCTHCSLHTTRRHAIIGEGNPRAPIVVIGEAPGAAEDKIGRPFVGKSGQLLEKIFAACGFSRQHHIFLTNIVRCRPPDNRVPSEAEVQACIPFLRRQIQLIDPQIIITLGGTALQRYMEDKNLRVSGLRGQWLTKEKPLVMPVYHPAALLRNPRLKPIAWADFKKVIDKYRELVDQDHIAPHY